MMNQNTNYGRHSILKNHFLRNLRKSLRDIIVNATNEKINKALTSNKDRQILWRALLNSICLCANSAACVTLYNLKKEHKQLPQFLTDLDMIWDPKGKKWYCVECFKLLKET